MIGQNRNIIGRRNRTGQNRNRIRKNRKIIEKNRNRIVQNRNRIGSFISVFRLLVQIGPYFKKKPNSVQSTDKEKVEKSIGLT